ncbi:hypothetical protein [Planctomicrobium sp. SH664]|uniref:hypothetical protein n=1 Tax=Planctomicrobium sp. SH664 TaxID=3448125 RepID=UPI003F5BD704
MFRYHRFWLPLLVIWATGCDPILRTGTVDGVAFVDGIPTGGLEITFTSTLNGSEAIGYSQQDGSYTLVRGRGHRELPVGEYKVTVVPTEMVYDIPKPELTLGGGVERLASTTFVQTIQEGPNIFDLKLTSQKKEFLPPE